MTELLRFPLGEEGDEGHVTVEIDDDEAGVVPASGIGDQLSASADSLRTVLEPVRRAAVTALETFQAVRPTTVSLEFGIRLHATAGAILTKAGAEGHLVVRLSWRRPGDQT